MCVYVYKASHFYTNYCLIQQLTSIGVLDMEVVVVEYILSTISVLEMKRDFHSVPATMKQDQEHTVMMWGYIAHMVSK